jgi:hypothetical protein
MINEMSDGVKELKKNNALQDVVMKDRYFELSC